MNTYDLEADLINTDWVVEKCKASDKYSQNLYAALCNNTFIKDNEEWGCSWRMSGGIIADIRDCGENYIDWYCSGIASDHIHDYVPESVITDEIMADLMKLGWTVKPYETYEGGVSPEAS